MVNSLVSLSQAKMWSVGKECWLLLREGLLMSIAHILKKLSRKPVMQNSALLLKKKLLCCVSSPTANQHVVELMLTWLHKASFSTVLNMLICIKQFSTAHDTPCGICWPMYMMTFVYSVGQYWLVYHWLLFWLHDVLFWSYFLVMCRCQILCQNLLVWQFICILYHSADFTMESC